MDRGLKISLAAGVLIAGLLTAWMFRLNVSSDEFPLEHATSATLQPQKQRLPLKQPKQPAAPSAQIRRGPREKSDRPPITIVAPLDAGEPPPDLARSYPYRHIPTELGNRIYLGPQASPSSPASWARPRRHRIVDGDTLEKLARRYFGDPARAEDIYQANRKVLSSRGILPIGVELAIPTPDATVTPQPQLMPRRPLVPIFRQDESVAGGQS